MNFTEILCIVTVASICANALLHWWFGWWFDRARQRWMESNKELIARLGARADEERE